MNFYRFGTNTAEELAKPESKQANIWENPKISIKIFVDNRAVQNGKKNSSNWAILPRIWKTMYLGSEKFHLIITGKVKTLHWRQLKKFRECFCIIFIWRKIWKEKNLMWQLRINLHSVNYKVWHIYLHNSQTSGALDSRDTEKIWKFETKGSIKKF